MKTSVRQLLIGVVMLNDLRYAVRMLLKNPGFVAIALLSLAIGIGANSAIYSFADAMLLRPLPVLKPSEVVTVNVPRSGEFGNSNSISYPDYVDLRDRNRTFAGLIASTYTSFGFSPTLAAQPRMKFGMLVSGNFFQVLGVEPALGRGFRPDEDRVPGRDAVVLISHDLWNEEFGASPAVIGRQIQLNSIPFTIIGVVPQTFTGMDKVKPALFVPVAMTSALGHAGTLDKRENRWLDVRGRLKRGARLAQAQADVKSIVSGLRAEFPKADENLQLQVLTELQYRTQNSPPDAALVLMLGLLAICVLLVACANVAGLLLSRSTVRSREIAVRLALGASRFALIRQLLMENLLLALGSGAAGLAVALAAIKFFNTLPIPTDVPIDLTFRLDQRALLFTLTIAVASTFLFGLAPALQGTRLDLMRALKERDGTASRATRLWGRNLIVAGQVALSLVLLIVSGVLVAGFQSELDRGPGFRTDRLQLMSFDPGLVHYTHQQREIFFKKLLDQTRQAPDVKSAALASNMPMVMGGVGTVGVIPDGLELKRGEHAIDTFNSIVTPGYFDTMAIPLLKGRDFLESDKADTRQVAIVNQEFAHRYWPNQNALGKRIRLSDASGKLVEVIGVAKLSKYLWITEAPTDFLYLPYAQNAKGNMTLVAQSKSFNAATLNPVLRQLVQQLDRNMPVFDVRTMQDLYSSRAVVTSRILTQTVGAMGIMSLILAVVGLYGVVSYSVSKRSREFGIRMAVGAGRSQITGMVLRQGLTLGIIGLGVGLLIGIVAARAITTTSLFSFAVGVLPVAAVSAMLLLAIGLSAYAPARRASRVDPIRALRDE